MKKGKNLNIWLPMLMFLLAMMSTATAEIIFVDADAPGANDGSSWTDAYNYLQDALTVSSSGDEIWVAQGIYKPDQGVGITPGDLRTTFQLMSGVTIKGGYAGFSEPDPNARDIDLYETILSGDLNGDDIDVNDPYDLWYEPSRFENSFHVVTGSGTDPTAVLDGFTITGGNANRDRMHGFGAGMFNVGGSPTVTNCTFTRNSAVGDGGGMLNAGSSPMVINCTFTGNIGYYGGGMNNSGGSPVLTNCTFSGNLAGGGGGGGMCNNSSSPTLTNCTFINNSGLYDGGGIHNLASNLTMTNCTFMGNSTNTGGGIYSAWYTSLTLTNCTFVGNSALNGRALACYSWRQKYPSNLQLINCILWDGGNEIWSNDGSDITVSYSDVQGGETGVYDPFEGLFWGEGNIDAEPCFVEPGYWDPNGTPQDANDDFWVDGDYRLLADSPCIDTGDPNYIAEPNETDLDGKPRVIGGRIDMGVYEYGQLVPAEVRIVPRTLNLSSEGKWITSLFWLPEDYDVADIDPNSVILECEIRADEVWLEGQVVMAKFSRSEVQGILNVGEAELTITGQLMDRTVFEGTDVIRVIDKGRGGENRG